MKVFKLVIALLSCFSLSSCEVLLYVLEAMLVDPYSYTPYGYSMYGTPDMGTIPSLEQYMAPMMNQMMKEADYIKSHPMKMTKEGYEEFVAATGSNMSYTEYMSTFGKQYSNTSDSYSSSSSATNTSSNSSVKHEERYGTIKCHMCDGSGVCSTCDGDGYYDGLGLTNISCHNCGPKAGSKVGKCSKCKGSGHVYGLLDLDGVPRW